MAVDTLQARWQDVRRAAHMTAAHPDAQNWRSLQDRLIRAASVETPRGVDVHDDWPILGVNVHNDWSRLGQAARLGDTFPEFLIIPKHTVCLQHPCRGTLMEPRMRGAQPRHIDVLTDNGMSDAWLLGFKCDLCGSLSYSYFVADAPVNNWHLSSGAWRLCMQDNMPEILLVSEARWGSHGFG